MRGRSGSPTAPFRNRSRESHQTLLSLWSITDYNLVMNIVDVTILKEKLSYYLGLVNSGEEVIVTSHRHRIARILPVTEAAARIVAAHPTCQRLAETQGY